MTLAVAREERDLHSPHVGERDRARWLAERGLDLADLSLPERPEGSSKAGPTNHPDDDSTHLSGSRALFTPRATR
jgi:hypothetical protein